MDNGHDNDAVNTNTGTNNPANTANSAPAPQPNSQQGIFSSPELSVNSENLDQIKPAVSADNQSRISSAFAQTDASASRDQLTAQMNAQAGSPTSAPIASGALVPANTTSSTASGDIRLPGTKKKSKLPLILACLAVVAAIAGITYFIVTQPRSETQDPGTQNTAVTAEAKQAFDKYATYLLYGEEKDTLDGEFDPNKQYTIDQQLDTESFNLEYWDKSTNLLSEVNKKLATVDSSMKSQLLGALANYQTYFNFLKGYRRAGELNEEQLFSAYVNGGTEAAQVFISTHYSAFSELDSDLAKAYIEQKTQQYSDMVEVYAIYNNAGCIQNGVLDRTSCGGNVSADVSQAFNNLSQSINNHMSAADNILKNATRYAKSYCWDFSDWLANPSKFEEETDEQNQ